MSSWMDEDFTKSETREHFLKECVNSKKVIPAECILQVAQCVNISVPRKNRESDASITDPKNSIVKVTLTDGKSSVQGLIPDYHPQLSSSTVPGTKVEIMREVPVVMGLIILDTRNIRVIGGTVPALLEQWKMQIATDKLRAWGFVSTRAGNDGPPLWKPFNVRGGGRVDRSDLRNVKAMDIVKEQTEGKTDDPSKSKFDAQRMETISELAKKAQAKSFGEGKRLVDKGVLDLINEGFSEEQAEEAMRKYKNPKKALKFLKNAKDNTSNSREDGEKDFTRGPRKGGRRKGRDDEDDDGPTGNELGEQPSNSINLFGFIAQKIKTEDEPPTSRPAQPEIQRETFTSTNTSSRGRRDDRTYRKDTESRFTPQDRDSRNGYKRYDDSKPSRFNDTSSMRQDSRENYNSGYPQRENGRDSYQRNDRNSYGNYDQRQNSADSYRQNDSRNFKSDRYGGSNPQRNARETAPPQRNFVPQQRRGNEINLEFSNSSQFPSLENEFSAPPQSMNFDHRTRRNEPTTESSFRQDFYRCGDTTAAGSYNRYGGRDDNQYRHSQGHQTYPARNREHDGYDRNSRQYSDTRNYRGGHHDHQGLDQRYNQMDQKFGNMALRSEYGNDGDWRPSQTMVFTRSKHTGGHAPSGHRDYIPKAGHGQQ